MKPVIIEVGLNEATSRQESPHVPITPEEIAADIVACADAGATIIHFHAAVAEFHLGSLQSDSIDIGSTPDRDQDLRADDLPFDPIPFED